MITSWDDYFIHQTPYPVLQTVVDTPNWIDRFYWNAQARNGSIMVGTGLGQYRTTGRMDSIVYVLTGREQRILRLGRHTSSDDYANPVIGPLRFEIVEPMQHWRWVLEENPTGVTWELDFRARWAPVDYRQFEFDNEDGNGSNYHHLVQLGTSQGTVEIDGQPVDIGGALHTSRDRSWGVRRPREGQGLLLWLQQRFSDVEISLILIEARDGSVTYFDGSATTASGRSSLVAVGHDLRMDPETRDMLGGIVEVSDTSGRAYRIEYAQRLLRGYVGGIGYGGWQGQDRGSFFAEAATIDMTRPTAEILAEQPMHLFAHLMRVSLDGNEQAVGDLEGGITRSSRYVYRPRPLSPGPLMHVSGQAALVTGGGSGLGHATAAALIRRGARVAVLDLPSDEAASRVTALGTAASFIAGDVRNTAAVEAALDGAARLGPLRIAVNCAGIGDPARTISRDGPLALERFRRVVDVNLLGTFNVIRLAAARIAQAEPEDGERGVIVNTASVAAFDGQIGQASYAASKAAIAGMTLPIARDLARSLIRVVTIAPGMFDTPILAGLPPEARRSIASQVPHPARLGQPDEYAALVVHIAENAMLNGETIRLDGAIRMSPR